MRLILFVMATTALTSIFNPPVAYAVKLQQIQQVDTPINENVGQTLVQTAIEAGTEAEAETEAEASTEVQIGAEAETGAEAEAEAGFIKMLLKPFFGPIIDLFMDMILHKPWTVSLGGDKIHDGLECYYNNWKPDTTIVTNKKKPKVFNFGNELK